MPYFLPEPEREEGVRRGLKRSGMLIFAITLHNIPEGLAVGVAFGALQRGAAPEAVMGAISIAFGIGLQNFPEGAVISMPLRATGMKKSRAFVCGALSGIVEPAAAFLTILAAGLVIPALPYLLSLPQEPCCTWWWRS